MHKRLRKEGFRVITMDLRGHGLSDKPHQPEAYGDNMVKDVVNLVKHLKIEKAHLVGYSLGGFIALKCAVEYPGYWLTVTPMASGWEDPENSKQFLSLQKAISDLESGHPTGPLIDYFDETGKKKSNFLHKHLFKIVITWFNDLKALVAIAKSVNALEVEKNQLEQLYMPVCSIIGDGDPFLRIAKEMSPNISKCNQTIVQGADHLNMPANVTAQDALVNFLKEHSN